MIRRYRIEYKVESNLRVHLYIQYTRNNKQSIRNVLKVFNNTTILTHIERVVALNAVK